MLAIAGGKGGCGKTTTALGLAAALAENGGTPTVVDADRDAPDVHLLADVISSDQTRFENTTDERSLESAALEANPAAGISIVSARSMPDDRMHVTLARFAGTNSPVLVDCPAGAGRDAVAPLRASDSVLLATTLSPASLRDAAKTAAMANRLGTDLVEVVLTRVAPWATESDEGAPTRPVAGQAIRPTIVRRVERLLDAPIVGQVPEVDRSGREVLDYPVVRTAYERLADGLRR